MQEIWQVVRWCSYCSLCRYLLEVEMKEKKDRVDDALSGATRAAIEEGIVQAVV